MVGIELWLMKMGIKSVAERSFLYPGTFISHCLSLGYGLIGAGYYVRTALSTVRKPGVRNRFGESAIP